MSYIPPDNAKISIEQMVDTRTSKTRYFRNRARGNKSPFFMLAITSPPMPYAEFMAYSAMVNSLEGSLEVFDLPNPLPALASFSGHRPDTTFNRGLKVIDIDTDADYKPGDFIQFDNHKKVYQIASKSNISGAIRLTLTCPLVETISTATTVLYGDDVVFQVCLNNQFSAEVDAGKSKFGVIDVELIEQA
uniref:hypothetical protein n=1 Tax=Ningiella ruwaisensis TaxID=2364274 RepID=UPI00109FED56|nr:hypothetical protein [Ningiella ruwaisensis]